MNFRQQNLIAQILGISFYFVVCFLLFVSVGEAQTNKNNVRRQTTEKMLAEAASAIASEDLTRAADILQKILVLEPRNWSAHTLAGVTAERQNNPAAAETHFAAAAKFNPAAAETHNNYGAILFRQNKKAEAAREFAASLKINPNQTSALINLAQIRFAENDYTAARELFIKAKTIAPDAEILRALVLISLERGEKERAVQEFKDYFASPVPTKDTTLGEMLLSKNLTTEAQKELEFILAGDADNIEALVLLSKVYLAQKNLSAAGKLLESAAARGTTARGTTEGKIYFALAEIYQTAGYLENAIPAMRLAIEKEPYNESYRLRYGLLLIDSKAPAAAVIRINEAIKDFPKSARLQLLLGMAQFDIGKSGEAQVAFENALALEPKLVPALGYLAIIYSEQGRFAEAAKIYERTIGYDDKNALLYYLLADTLLKIQDAPQERIESEIKRSITLDANLGLAYSVLGRLYVRQARWMEARTTLERGVELNPKMADALYQLGLVYARLKLTEESKATLAKFKELNVSLEKQKEEDRREIVRRLANTKF